MSNIVYLINVVSSAYCCFCGFFGCVREVVPLIKGCVTGKQYRSECIQSTVQYSGIVRDLYVVSFLLIL